MFYVVSWKYNATVCPRGSDPFHIVNYFINWAKRMIAPDIRSDIAGEKNHSAYEVFIYIGIHIFSKFILQKPRIRFNL